MKISEAVVAGGIRTPIGNFGGAIRDVPVIQLGARVIGEVLRRNGLRPIVPEENVTFRPKLLDQKMTELEKKFYSWDNVLQEIAIDEVIMGNALQAGQGQNVARQASENWD
jgi:acetyl-CoA C-acetyltransferase